MRHVNLAGIHIDPKVSILFVFHAYNISPLFGQVNECECTSDSIGEMISLDGEHDQKFSSFLVVPNDFFEDMESSWKGRIKRMHIEEVVAEVEKAAEALSLAVGLQHSTLAHTFTCLKINFKLYCPRRHYIKISTFSFLIISILMYICS